MYKKKEKLYCEAGCYLRSASQIGYVMNYSSDVIEVKQKFDLEYNNKLNLLTWSNKLLAMNIKPDITYEDLKKKIISLKYDNDDQIAIILNKDEDPIIYNKMQEWREFAKDLATRIIKIIR